MQPRQKYVRLSEGQILVLPKHKKLIDDHVAHRGVRINQAVRDIIDYAEYHGFFLNGSIANGQVSSTKGE